MRVLLLTQNAGRLFDAPPPALATWATELRSWVDAAAADFVGLHVQELGGKAGKQGDLGQVSAFAEAVAAAFPSYWYA